MSDVAESAVAAVPIDANVQGLERRLLELRAEIDAILTQLAGQKTASPADEPAVTHALRAQEANAESIEIEASLPDLADVAPDAGKPAQVAIETDVAVDADGERASHLEAETADQQCAAQSISGNAPVAGLPTVDEASEIASTQGEARDDRSLIAALDAVQVVEEAAVSTAADATAMDTQTENKPAAEVVDVSAAPEPIAEVAAQETEIVAAAADAGEPATTDVASLPAVADNPVKAAAGAEVRVIDFEPRHRKQKGAFVASAAAAPARRGRRIATRVAAGIVALIAAATVLMVSDRTAVGSTLSLHWNSPLPSYLPTRANWPFLGQFKSSGQIPALGDQDQAADAALAAAHEALLARYREVWPMSP